MSLNDAALDDLDQEADYLTQGEGEAASIGVARVVTDDELDVKVPKEVDEAVSALSDYDVQIQTTKDDVTKIHELSDVANTVLAQETISQADAEEVNRVYGGLYEEVASAKEYTQAPSSINLQQTKDFVKEKLEDVKQTAIQRHQEYMSKTFTHASCLLKCLKEDLLPELYEDMEVARRHALSDLAEASVSKKFVIYSTPRMNKEGEVSQPPRLVDLKTLAMYDSVRREEYELPASLQSLPSDDDVHKLRDVFHGAVFRKLMKESDLYRDVLESLHRSYHEFGDGRGDVYCLTYIDLLGILSSGKIESYIKDAFNALEEVFVNAEAVINKTLADGASEEDLSESSLIVSDLYEKLLLAEKFRMTMAMFLYRAKPILEGFRAAL